MHKCQFKNSFNDRKDNISPPDPSDATSARHEHFNAAETKENDLSNNNMKMIQALKQEMKNSFKEIKKKSKNGRNQYIA